MEHMELESVDNADWNVSMHGKRCKHRTLAHNIARPQVLAPKGLEALAESPSLDPLTAFHHLRPIHFPTPS